MHILVNIQVEVKKWNDLLAKGYFTTPFQTPEFYNICNDTESFCADVFAVEISEKYNSLVVVTRMKEKGLKAFFSRRGIIFGGPLIENEQHNSVEYLFSYIIEFYYKKLIYIETRNFFDYSFLSDCFYKLGWRYEIYLNYQILLQGKSMDEILSTMKNNRRREILHSIREGAIAEETKNIDDVKVLYNILVEVYKNRVKVPLPNLDFFIGLFNSKIGKIFIIKHKEQIIGGSFCLYCNNASIYTMYYTSLRDYHPKIFPTHLAILAAIDFGLKNGLNKLDMMGAGKPIKEYGVRKYKSEFGGELVEHGRFIKVYSPFLFDLGKLGLSILKKTR